MARNRRLIFLTIGFFLLAPSIGAVYYYLEGSQAEHQEADSLQNIIGAKSRAIQQWAKERAGDSLIFASADNFAEGVERLLQNPNDPTFLKIGRAHV